jgi:hypothetical protein
MPSDACLHVGRIQPDIGIGRCAQRPRAETLHLAVQLLTQHRYLALADPREPQRLHELVHPTGGNPLHIRLLHHRHQRPFRPPTGLEQAREIAAVADPRHPQTDAAHPRIPAPFSTAVAFPGAPGSPLVPAGPQVLGYLRFHQGLGQCVHPFSQEIDVIAHLCLAHELLKCHADLTGHLVVLLTRAFVHYPMRITWWPVRQPLPLSHTSLDTVGKSLASELER